MFLTTVTLGQLKWKHRYSGWKVSVGWTSTGPLSKETFACWSAPHQPGPIKASLPVGRTISWGWNYEHLALSRCSAICIVNPNKNKNVNVNGWASASEVRVRSEFLSYHELLDIICRLSTPADPDCNLFFPAHPVQHPIHLIVPPSDVGLWRHFICCVITSHSVEARIWIHPQSSKVCNLMLSEATSPGCPPT